MIGEWVYACCDWIVTWTDISSVDRQEIVMMVRTVKQPEGESMEVLTAKAQIVTIGPDAHQGVLTPMKAML